MQGRSDAGVRSFGRQRAPSGLHASWRTRRAELSRQQGEDPYLPGKATDRDDRKIHERAMTDTRRYPAHVFWSEEDAGYIALATDLPGCSAFGETQDAALAELQDAIDAWVEAQRSAGNRIPQPSTPAQEHSGKVLVR